MADSYYDFHGLQGEVKKFLVKEGYSETEPPPDYPGLVNQAWAEFSWDTECVEAQGTELTLGVSAGPEFLVLTAPSWKSIYHCRYGSSDSYLDETSLRKEMDENPHLLTVGVSTPTRYALSEPDMLVLIPGSSTVGTTVTFRGIREGSAMSLDNDEPACPKVFRAGIVYRAVLKHLEAYCDNLDKLVYYEKKYKIEVSKLKSYLAPLRGRGAIRRTPHRLAERVRIT